MDLQYIQGRLGINKYSININTTALVTKRCLLSQQSQPGRVDGEACHIQPFLAPQLHILHGYSSPSSWPAGNAGQPQAHIIVLGQENSEFAPEFDILLMKHFCYEFPSFLLKRE